MDWDRLAKWLTEAFSPVDEEPEHRAPEADGDGPFRVVYLIWSLSDTDPKVRRIAAERLGDLGDPQSVNALMRALRDADADVRRSATAALVRLGVDGRDIRVASGAPEPAGPPRRRDTRPAVPLGEPGTSGPPDQGILLAALSDVDLNIRAWAAEELARRGRAVVPPLLTVLANGALLAREMAAHVLAEIADPDATPALLAALRGPGDRVRAAAARALGKTKEPEATILGDTLISPLIRALGDEAPVVRQAAREALQPLHQGALAEAVFSALSGVPGAVVAVSDPRACEPLILALGHGDPSLRWNAAAALGLLRDPRACEPLVALLADWRSGLQDAAAKALVRIGEPAVRPLVNALAGDAEVGRRAAAGVLREIRPEALVRELAEGSPAAREAAALALGGVSAPGAAAALARALQDENGPVRRAAAEALGETADGGAAGGLTGALGDSVPMVRRAAAVALGRLGVAAGGALARLREGRRDPSREVRDACAGALQAIEEALRHAPAELEAAERPMGRGTELQAADRPAGRGTEPESAASGE